MDKYSLNFKDILSVSMILFAVIDIVGTIPVVIDIRNKTGHIKAFRTALVSMIIMVAFLFLGEGILHIIGIDKPSFAIAGSFVIFFIAMELLLGIRIYRDNIPATASIVPLAFPLIAGTGTMTTLLSLRSQFNIPTILIGIVLNVVVIYFVLRLVRQIEHLLGPAGISVLRKIFGVVLLAIAIKLFLTNIKIALHY